MIVLRPARAEDTNAMAAMLTRIIASGGLTAIAGPVTPDTLRRWMEQAPGRTCWHVATDGAGRLLGLQWAEPHPALPPEAADIASFVQPGLTGSGIGTRLFRTTRPTARALGYRWINAAIRSDNAGALRYYGRIGFRIWKRDPAARLPSGQVTGKTYMRFDL